MSVSTARLMCGVAPIMMLAQAAQADISAQEVWADWRAYFEAGGYEITAEETAGASQLTQRNITMTQEQTLAGGEELTTVVTLEELVFSENGDGTVNVSFPASQTVGFTVDPDGEEVSGTLLVTSDGQPMKVSGTAEDITYDYATANLGVKLTEFSVDGTEVPELVLRFAMDLTDVTSRIEASGADLRSYAQVVSAGMFNFDMTMNDPKGGAAFDYKSTVESLSFKGDLSMPMNADTNEPAEMIEQGFGVDGTYGFGKASFEFSGQDDEGNSTRGQGSSESGEATVDMGLDGIAFEVQQDGVEMTVMGGGIPFPLSSSMEQLGMNFAMPLLKSDEEQNFALGMTLRDFVVPDMFWAMLDPTNELPHDPATLVVDLTGTGTLLVDLMDEAAMAAVDDGDMAPGELNSIKINELLLSAVGAKVTGAGAFTFDNSDMETFDGMPAPTGSADLQIEGANTLIDKLVALGLIQDSDAMGARMMMGMFTVAGEGEDVLTTNIEVKGDGEVRANGQRLR